MTTTPLNPSPIPRAIQAFSRSRRTKWERTPTISGWEVTRMTEEATLTLTPSIFSDPIQRVKCVARIAPTAIIPRISFQERANSPPRFQRPHGQRNSDAEADQDEAEGAGLVAVRGELLVRGLRPVRCVTFPAYMVPCAVRIMVLTRRRPGCRPRDDRDVEGAGDDTRRLFRGHGRGVRYRESDRGVDDPQRCAQRPRRAGRKREHG